eukprot:TRINITY_DN62683_c0_g1_i1.p1 TRINITY_DN62683_c0_g1~~TRINITY_DN62683_c0_g1_i1.p1  ORF type:complete len:781 (+),score=204.61 TRINITY_DN62683_c0_g1_i1:100-2442(+)
MSALSPKVQTISGDLQAEGAQLRADLSRLREERDAAGAALQQAAAPLQEGSTALRLRANEERLQLVQQQLEVVASERDVAWARAEAMERNLERERIAAQEVAIQAVQAREDGNMRVQKALHQLAASEAQVMTMHSSLEEERCRELEDALSDSTATRNALMTEIQDLQRRLVDASSPDTCGNCSGGQHKGLKLEMDEALGLRANALEQLDQTQAKLAALEVQHASLRLSTECRAEAFAQELADTQAKLADTQAKLVSANSKLASQSSEMQAAGELLSDVQRRLATAEAQNIVLESSFQKDEHREAEAECHLASVEARLATAEANGASLIESWEAEKLHVADEEKCLRHFEAEVAAAEEQTAAVETRLAVTEASLQRRELEQAALTARLEAAEKERLEANRHLHVAETLQHSLTRDIESEKSACRQQELQSQLVTSERDELIEREQRWQQLAHDLKAELKTAEEAAKDKPLAQGSKLRQALLKNDHSDGKKLAETSGRAGSSVASATTLFMPRQLPPLPLTPPPEEPEEMALEGAELDEMPSLEVQIDAEGEEQESLQLSVPQEQGSVPVLPPPRIAGITCADPDDQAKLPSPIRFKRDSSSSIGTHSGALGASCVIAVHSPDIDRPVHTAQLWAPTAQSGQLRSQVASHSASRVYLDASIDSLDSIRAGHSAMASKYEQVHTIERVAVESVLLPTQVPPLTPRRSTTLSMHSLNSAQTNLAVGSQAFVQAAGQENYATPSFESLDRVRSFSTQLLNGVSEANTVPSVVQHLASIAPAWAQQ